MHTYHALSVEEVSKELHTSLRGLDAAEVLKRRVENGQNDLPREERVSYAVLFARQFKSWFIYILFGAAALSLALAHILDAAIILAIIILNAAISFVQEARAENAIAALRSMVIQRAKVIRDGAVDVVDAVELVCGDVVLLQAGDRIPADGRVVHCRDFSTQEASLTGESFTVRKSSHVLNAGTVLADRVNMVWMGTSVASGTATFIVTAVGAATELGNIATSIKHTEREETHFRKKTNRLAMQLGVVAIGSAILMFFVAYIVRGVPFIEVVIFSIAMLVSSIPEGLPAVLAVVLAIGAHRMAQKKAIVRNLPIIEDLSVTSIILTDKTGTLTQNTMTVRLIITAEKETRVTGEGWEPKGSFIVDDIPIEPQSDPVLEKVFFVAALCNSAQIHKEGTQYEIAGDPTEASFVVLAEKAGLTRELLDQRYKIIDQRPFSQSTRSQSVLVARPKRELFVIGGEEAILNASTHYMSERGVRKLDAEVRQILRERLRGLTKSAMRVVALGDRVVPAGTERIDDALVSNLTFLGFLGIADPIRAEAPGAISQAQGAGIRVIMVTGDHADTARAIAREVGLTRTDSDLVYTEQQLRAMHPADFQKAIETCSVFARMTPSMKYDIIAALQLKGYRVAMIGDGVNDAPALKKANVGIAMGTIGTDVAREASDIILSDDNFATLIKAIEQGRLIFDNIRQTSFFMITTSVAEILTLLVSLLFVGSLPLTALQILWINLITDGIPNIALAAERQHGDVLHRPPRSKSETIISKEIIPFLLLTVFVMTGATIVMYRMYLPFGIEHARTIAFAVLVFFQLFNAMNMRSLEHSIFKIGFFSNHFMTGALLLSFAVQILVMIMPAAQQAFGLVPLKFFEFIWIGIITFMIIVVVELYKLWRILSVQKDLFAK